jgi:hypothetical protein
MKQTTVATGRKGRVDKKKKGWTRKPENPKKRRGANVRSFLRSVHLSGIKPHLPNLFNILAEISKFKGRKFVKLVHLVGFNTRNLLRCTVTRT